MPHDFTIYRTTDKNLLKIVDFFFYIDIPFEVYQKLEEDIIPYPRVTIGYFFENPFWVTEADKSVNFIASRIIEQKITVKPNQQKIKIMGMHLKPYALAYFTEKSVRDLPFVIELPHFFKKGTDTFLQKIKQLTYETEQFELFENLLIQNMKSRDLPIVTKAVEMIERANGNIKISEIAKTLEVSSRTLQNHFNHNIGCSPKAYIQLVKLNKSLSDIKNSDENLTSISYNNHYFDQTHFIKTIKSATGKTPKFLKKENGLSDFYYFSS
ncbi:helix-turn-helix domain-containing protein [Weeksellaceae bacterium TAE3-ERU29]|nr:helix-turn-helix domain-containing protein [Weeksellaceae bacterium TAE3-ERU29]